MLESRQCTKSHELDISSIIDECDTLKSDLKSWWKGVNNNRHSSVEAFCAYLTTRQEEISAVEKNCLWLQERIGEDHQEVDARQQAINAEDAKNEGLSEEFGALQEAIEKLRKEIDEQKQELERQQAEYAMKSKEARTLTGSYLEEINLFSKNLGIDIRTPDDATGTRRTRWSFKLLSPTAPDQEAWYDLHYCSNTRTYNVTNCSPHIPDIEKYVTYFNSGAITLGGFTCLMRESFKRIILKQQD